MEFAEQVVNEQPIPGVDKILDEINTRFAVDEFSFLTKSAIDDVALFFPFVMREERTRQALDLAPHQEVLFAFVDAFKMSVVRMPVGTSKTFCMAALTLHLLGMDSTQRGAIVSSTQTQASKVVKMVSDYITDTNLNGPLQGIFPNLRRSHREGDPWTQTKLTVERPAGIRDASLTALGIGTAVLGSRFSWVLCDDILSQENTYTPESREKVYNFFEGSILSRVDPGPHAKVVVTNTPWNQDDITYRLENVGWPCITMSIYGDIEISNVDWDNPEKSHTTREKLDKLLSFLRPSNTSKKSWRLKAHDPDPDDEAPLWPSRYDIEEIEQIKNRRTPQQFANSYLCKAVDDASSRCKQAWVDLCVKNGNGYDFVHQFDQSLWPQGAFTVTGVDLAAKKKNDTALTVLFTALVLPNEDMRILHIDAGRYNSPEIRDLIISHHDRYSSCVFVEDNGIQQWMLDMIGEKRAIPVWPFSTGVNKWHPAYGVESVFLLMSQGKWIIPNQNGKVEKPVQKWIDECKGFAPNAHTGDLLMASWFAKEGARVVRQNIGYFFDDADNDDDGVMIFQAGVDRDGSLSDSRSTNE